MKKQPIIYRGYEIIETCRPYPDINERYDVTEPGYDGAPDGNNGLWSAGSIVEAIELIIEESRKILCEQLEDGDIDEIDLDISPETLIIYTKKEKNEKSPDYNNDAGESH